MSPKNIHYSFNTFTSSYIFHQVLLVTRERCRQSYLKIKYRASLVAQWLRIRLPMQGTRVRALVQEDPTCRGAAKPVCHNY